MKTGMQLYNVSECQVKLKELHLDWKCNRNGIEKEFQFLDFKEAIEFITQVAQVAEDKKHHPEWTNVYNRVMIRLTTHDSGGVTDKDFELALAMEQILRK